MACPYHRLELLVALSTAVKKVEKISEEQGEEFINKEIPQLPEPAELNKVVAERNGISVEALIASPNYKVLKQEYMESVFSELRMKLQEKFGLTDKESWAIFLANELCP